MIQAQLPLDQLFLDDEIAWYDAMVERIDSKEYDELDHVNLRELLADMSLRERHEVESRLTVLILHILKWDHQPKKRSTSWASTIVVQSQELVRHFRSGVLRNHADSALTDVYAKAVRRAMIETGLPKSVFPAACQYSIAELLSFEASIDTDGLIDPPHPEEPDTTAADD